MFYAPADRPIGNRFHKIMKGFISRGKRVNQAVFGFVRCITWTARRRPRLRRDNISNIERLR